MVLLLGLICLHPLIVKEEVCNLLAVLVLKGGQLRKFIIIFYPFNARAELPLPLLLVWLDTSDKKQLLEGVWGSFIQRYQRGEHEAVVVGPDNFPVSALVRIF